ncbi:class I SAM-dependent methyltransferase [Candidatus Pelagibacter sp.]|jgi:2-polyprenyl-3-methyl-5-hydroxy-6-metoxy-1,4-benzoquinol methylase|uniref:methyltransferase domain-containing protein n=1 Tax=uncultured Candidatus Pelagibacter sp. TaxID=372654 RepID=UPI00236AD525|nr:class I SAM-dependent methyltransferase [uncultured Candidatus Pelagibacter sp.]MDC0428559.1 class I SAM-dependent methyltransferase [Candidatus Pelagibacter sp.]MDC0862235.1 class I SAM-dependent methyltransferase [bacterium]MDC1076989.1 class I SAM-dependent methyltransferase [Candidatus Pelagibacter sp.]
MGPLKNWDNKTWLSSQKYIKFFNRFILKQVKLNRNSRILDIGCGRGKILENLSNKLRLLDKPVGLDIENHKDKSKKIIFKKIDALSYVSKTKITFDLILIKQTIHLLKKKQAIKLLSICKNKLNPNGKIIILSLNPNKNEIPTFQLMNKKLNISLKKDEKLFNLILKNQNKFVIKKFTFDVKILKTKYLQMIKKRYISTLLNFSNKQINEGLNEIKKDYGKVLKFKDRLIAFIIKK